MRVRTLIFALLAAAVFAAGPVFPSFAQKGEQDRALELRKNQDLIPYGEIAKKAERQFGGRVVGQSLKDQGGRMVYELRLLKPDGKVLIVVMDAKTGRVLRTRGG